MIGDTLNKIDDLSKCVCHSGGAIGSDSYWENTTLKYGGKALSYSYKTDYHNSVNKVEITDDQYKEGLEKVKSVSKILARTFNPKYGSLLSRNWFQVKYSDVIYAIGEIVLSGDKNKKGYKNKSKLPIVDGGTGYAVMMGIQHGRDVYVFDQEKDRWYKWSYIVNSFKEIVSDSVFIYTDNFAGIGTRDIKQNGINAISIVFNNTINK